MLNEFQRLARYLAQTGRSAPTAPQRRRIKHKQGHQSVEAGHVRESRSADRKERAARKRRSAPPVQGAQMSAPDGAANGRVTGPNHNNGKNLMTRIILAAMGVVALLLGGFTTSTASASTSAVADAPVAGDLKVWRVGTDAMGGDSFANRNREFVTFKNVSGKVLDIKNVLVEDNWAHTRTVADREHSCNTYKITDLPDNSSTEIAPNEYVTVFNGVRTGGDYKTGSEYRLYADSDVDCGYQGHFFNNNNDTAWVTKADGDVLTKRSWDWGGGYAVYGAN